MFPRTAQPDRSGFSLVEMVVVMAGIAVLTALVVPAVTGFGRSAALATGGNKVANLAAAARQTAISKNTMTALVMLAAQGTDDDFRAFTILEYTAKSGWWQAAPWERLPDGVVVDRTDSANCTFLAHSPQPFPFVSGPPPQANPPVLYQGKQVTDVTGYAARIFMPNGGLQNPDQPAQLRLVEGVTSGSVITYTHRGEGGKPANFYDIAIVGATGVAKVSRP